MLRNSSMPDIQTQYNLGERNFPKLQLRRIDLRGEKLRGINLEGSDLSYADLRDTDLSNANLSGCYFNEANLTAAKLEGANLKGAYLIKAYLTKANFQKAILQEAYLTGAFLTKANFMKADLTGAYLTGTQISGAYFKGAIYSSATRFERGFDPALAGMAQISTFNMAANRKITIDNLITNFEQIASLTSNYLGITITAKYLDSSRPEIEWLQNFKIDHKSKITFDGSLNAKVTSIQLKWFEKWQTAFIKSCSIFVQDLPNMIREKHLGIDHIGENVAA